MSVAFLCCPGLIGVARVVLLRAPRPRVRDANPSAMGELFGSSLDLFVANRLGDGHYLSSDDIRRDAR